MSLIIKKTRNFKPTPIVKPVENDNGNDGNNNNNGNVVAQMKRFKYRGLCVLLPCRSFRKFCLYNGCQRCPNISSIFLGETFVEEHSNTERTRIYIMGRKLGMKKQE
jgi:hypothetical protein